MGVLILWALQLMENKIQTSVNELTHNHTFAVGNDIVFLPNFGLSLTPEFKNKAYTAAELEYCGQFSNAALHYASTWAAKEAVYKAVKQLDPKALGWKKIEIIREKPGGQPHAILHQHPGSFKISLTISHDGDYIWAIALIEIK
jgi:holo-[acyl-carrier protein] synthase